LFAAYNLAEVLRQQCKHLEWLFLQAYRGAVTIKNSCPQVDFEVRESEDLRIK